MKDNDISYCCVCWTDKPWHHDQDPAYKIFLRKIRALLTLKARIRVEIYRVR